MSDNTELIAVQRQLIEMQSQLLAAQKEIIKLQKQINRITPKQVKDKDIFWHMNSDGLYSIDAANSDDLVTIRQFHSWLTNFAKKHIMPYVNPKVYGECLNQMTRGLGERESALQTKLEVKAMQSGVKPSVALRMYER